MRRWFFTGSDGELDAEPREAQQDLGARVLMDRLLHHLREAVGRNVGSVQLDEMGKHLLAEGILDERRLVSPVGLESVPEAVDF